MGKENETKLCKYCKTEIPKGAKVCPHCRKKQGGKAKWVVIVLAVIFAFIMIVGGQDDSSSSGKNTQSNAESTETVSNDSNAKSESETETGDSTITAGQSFEANGLSVTVNEVSADFTDYNNDYGMNVEGRRNTVVKMVKDMKEKGLRVDAIGMQGHMGMDYPDIKEFEESILAFASTGAKVMITEWDMSALPTAKQGANISDTVAYRKILNPYPEALPDSVSEQWNARMEAFFNLFIKHSDVITRVTAWGVTDGDSWKNDFPVRGRRDYPLLFDRNYQPKSFVTELIEKK